jgi:SNF2 family DNA or RNA helicase
MVLRTLLKETSPETRKRGRVLFDDGRVFLEDDASVEAEGTARGTVLVRVEVEEEVDVAEARYPILFAFDARAPEKGGRALDCSCRCTAFLRFGECKHVAAAAYALLEAGSKSPFADLEIPQRSEANPAQSGATSRTEKVRAVETWLRPLTGHEQVARLSLFFQDDLAFRRELTTLGLGHFLLQHYNVVADAVSELRTWIPPVQREEGTGVAASERIAQLYDELRLQYLRATVRGGISLPLPSSGRFSGWEFSVRGVELLALSPRHVGATRGLRVRLSLSGPSTVQWTTEYAVDGAQLSALRALLAELARKESPLGLALVGFFARAPADLLVEQLAAKGAERKLAVVDVAFQFRAVEAGVSVRMMRRSSLRGKDPGPFKFIEKVRLFKGEERAKLSFADKAGLDLMQVREDAFRGAARPNEPWLVAFVANLFGASHLQIAVADRDGPDQIRAAALKRKRITLRFREDSDAESRELALHGTFCADETPLSFAEARKFELACGDNEEMVWLSESEIWLVTFPYALRTWLKTATELGSDCLRVPERLFPALRERLMPLAHAGSAMLPEALLGAVMTYTPKVALSVEWGEASTITVMIEVCKAAPLVLAADGPKQFSFASDNGLAYVERDFAKELLVVEEVLFDLGKISEFHKSVARLSGPEEHSAFLSWIHERQGTLRVDVRTGRRPKTLGFEALQMSLAIEKRERWFKLRPDSSGGELSLGLGELLQAVRQALGFVRLQNGTYLEITPKLRDDLTPLAFAAETHSDGSVHVPEAFGHTLLSLDTVFAKVTGELDWKALAARFQDRNKAPSVPKITGGTLRPYQVVGVQFMLSLADWCPGCVLADDMGLGKTVQTASLLIARAALGPQLVIAPASVSFNWKSELARFASGLRVIWFNEDRAEDLGKLGPGDVLVVSYGLVQQRAAAFEREWTTLVVDEAQYLKNHLAKRRAAIAGLRRNFTLCLTGTPIENHLGELWSILDLAFPGILSDAQSFRERFRITIEGFGNAPVDQRARALTALRGLIAPFLLRRTRKSVLLELPNREEMTELIDLSPPEQFRYESLRRACEDQFAQAGERAAPLSLAQQRIQMLSALMRLRQIACHPGLVDPNYDGPSSKLERLLELLEGLRPQFEEGQAQELEVDTPKGSKGNRKKATQTQSASEVDELPAAAMRTGVLVFSQFTTLLRRAKTAAETAGFRIAYLDGGTSLPERKRLVDEFQADGFDIFFVSLTAGGTGLNLTRANYVIHLDPWWNPAVEEQATSRAHRMGQTRPITVYRLVARGTVEEGILELHGKKREMAEAVLSEQDTKADVQPEDLRSLIRFGASKLPV